MEPEIEKIFSDQLLKLPEDVKDYLSTENWEDNLDEIGKNYNLSETELFGVNREATLVLVGLMHPDAFGFMLETEVGITNRAVLESLTAEVEEKIFAPVRPALIEFFEKEASGAEAWAPEVNGNAEETVVETVSPPSLLSRTQNLPRKPDIAPENLPVGEETEPLFPPIPEKINSANEEGGVHPFEEKMKRVLTAGTQQMGELAIETPAPPSSISSVPPIYHADPYREPIE